MAPTPAEARELAQALDEFKQADQLAGRVRENTSDDEAVRRAEAYLEKRSALQDKIDELGA